MTSWYGMMSLGSMKSKVKDLMSILSSYFVKNYLTNFVIACICVSCSQPQNDKPSSKQTSDYQGEWRLDSSDSRFYSDDRLFITDSGEFYLFSLSEGGSLKLKGKRNKDGLYETDYSDTFSITRVDSKRIQTEMGSGIGMTRPVNFFIQVSFKDNRSRLIEHLLADSLRTKILGWWKLANPGQPLRFMNSSEEARAFTLNVRDDGEAVIYLENYLDSTINYHYRMEPDGISLQRGDVVGGSSYLDFNAKGQLRLVLDFRNKDTLILERIRKIR